MIRKLIPILGITFIDILGFSMLLPVLPYFVTHFGMSALVVGILISTFSFCQFVSGPIWGNVSDRIGRKSVLIISQIGATIGWAMLAFAGNIYWVFVARIVEGISGGNIGITQAYVADLVEPKERARAFGLISATFGAAMIFGPASAGALFLRFGYPAPFLAASALQFITLLATIALLPESRSKHQEEEEERVGYREIFATFHNQRLRPILFQKLALSLALYAWFAVIALYLKGQLGSGLVETTQFFSAYAVVTVIINAFGVGKASERMGDVRMSLAGLLILIAGFAFVPFAHDLLAVAGIMLLTGLGMAFASNGITAQISNAATAREQGTVLGVGSSLDSLSGILAPPASTGILSHYGSPFAGAASLVMSAVSLAFGVRNTLIHQPVVALGDDANVQADELEATT
jgi:MFS transporter, DHA1 family, tetracycline resistance protein